MNKLLHFILGTLLMPGIVAAQGIAWQPSFEKALEVAKSERKPLMIDFFTDWCSWCKKLDRDTYTDSGVIQRSRQFVTIKLDAQKAGRALAARFRVRGFPTILFLDNSEKVIWRIVGYKPPSGFSQEMDKAVKAFVNKSKFEGRLRTNPNDTESLAGLVPIYAIGGEIKRAEEMLTRAEKAGANIDILADGYNAMGDHYQAEGDFNRAIALFKKALAATDKRKQAYALISIATCYFQANERDKAKPFLERLLTIGDAGLEYRQLAENMIRRIGG